jgi:catechol 2,3-dioxygenase-like lactoylglutathione lyase family enzyme
MTQIVIERDIESSTVVVDMKLEVVVIPVSNVERAKQFYGANLGWRLDADFVVGDDFHAVQFTPPPVPDPPLELNRTLEDPPVLGLDPSPLLLDPPLHAPPV